MRQKQGNVYIQWRICICMNVCGGKTVVMRFVQRRGRGDENPFSSNSNAAFQKIFSLSLGPVAESIKLPQRFSYVDACV
jgi:hypothetical protein